MERNETPIECLSPLKNNRPRTIKAITDACQTWSNLEAKERIRIKWKGKERVKSGCDETWPLRTAMSVFCRWQERILIRGSSNSSKISREVNSESKRNRADCTWTLNAAYLRFERRLLGWRLNVKSACGQLYLPTCDLPFCQLCRKPPIVLYTKQQGGHGKRGREEEGGGEGRHFVLCS